ncbi:LytR/AlgR family response regulator transcription factor [Flavobacterium selenitireducens]|uniref:LytR/AlgR family response regulator transcription factor n=1 Tax=Flavobacterium selenitireducens TaxID=2722704 RepID=UPI00168ADCCE|nr:LytTR family DNA-binding domain-containing protein [Flavobacterium selenitireducens]MBD3582014.1 response regulator transcription factor [Flavobacterium selenitireducens]
MKSFKCLILDDDELDRLSLLSNVKRFPEFEIAGVFASASDALAALSATAFDVLFLDIDMPGMNGLEFRQAAANVPVCIFISAHPQHAIETFALDTLDFIVKPLKSERFAQTVQRIHDYMELREKASLFESSLGADVIYIKEGYGQTKVKLHDILYLEALKDYTKIVTRHKRHCVLSNLGTLLKEPTFASFLRIHRSFAVQRQFVEKILPNEVVLHGGLSVPLGRSYKDSLSDLMPD